MNTLYHLDVNTYISTEKSVASPQWKTSSGVLCGGD